jgi:hypothetical protein
VTPQGVQVAVVARQAGHASGNNIVVKGTAKKNESQPATARCWRALLVLRRYVHAVGGASKPSWKNAELVRAAIEVDLQDCDRVFG